MNKPMHLIVLILNKTECLDFLLKELVRIGVKGATIVDSTGLARALDDDALSIFGSLRLMIDQDRESNKTILMAVNDDLIPLVRQTVDEAVGGIEQPDTGVLFGLPISFFDGKASKS
ncbi:MAG: hypothetical protein ACYCYM_11375 [Saccharofermentanales bacterium]